MNAEEANSSVEFDKKLHGEESIQWEQPIPLTISHVEDWPRDLLPDPLMSFAHAVSASTETPLEIATNDILAVLGTSAQRKFEIELKSDYREPLCYWGMGVQPPASRKTRVKAHTMKPLIEYEREGISAMRDQIRTAESERATQKKIIEAERGKVVKITDFLERKSLVKRIAEAESALTDVPTYPRLWTDDVTPEKLAMLMAENHERLGIFSAEGGLFGILAGRYSNGAPNLNIFLKSHAGDPERVDRGSRDTVFLNNPALSMGLTVQPEVLRGLTQKREFRGFGLLARFAYALPKNTLGHRTMSAPTVSEELIMRYGARIKAILAIPWKEDSVTGDNIPRVLKLSEDAWSLWLRFWHEIEHKLTDGGELSHIQDWGGKLPGLVARVAGLIHVARHGDGSPEDHPVSDLDMDLAIEWGTAVKSHTLAAFDYMGADQALEDARTILKWIGRIKKTEFTFRECHHGNQRKFPRAEAVEPAIRVLEERHFIRERPHGKRSGRPTRRFSVNPQFRFQ